MKCEIGAINAAVDRVWSTIRLDVFDQNAWNHINGVTATTWEIVWEATRGATSEVTSGATSEVTKEVTKELL